MPAVVHGVLTIGAPPAFLKCDSGYASVYKPSEKESSGHSLIY